MIKKRRIELYARLGAIAVLCGLLMLPSQFPAIIDWLRHDKPPETEQVAPITVEEVKQQVMLEQVKNAEGSSVLIKTEKIGDDVVPLVVRHYARWTELGEVEYWVEQIKE